MGSKVGREKRKFSAFCFGKFFRFLGVMSEMAKMSFQRPTCLIFALTFNEYLDFKMLIFRRYYCDVYSDDGVWFFEMLV